MVHNGQTGRSVRERLNEHIGNTNLNQTDKSAIAQHNYKTGCGIMFNSIRILPKEHRKRLSLIKDAEDKKNRDDGLKLKPHMDICTTTGRHPLIGQEQTSRVDQ